MNCDNKYIMWLSSLNNIKLSIRRKLLDYFGSGEELWLANSKDLKYSEILNTATIENLKSLIILMINSIQKMMKNILKN